jgi:hypothetical protein
MFHGLRCIPRSLTRTNDSPHVVAQVRLAGLFDRQEIVAGGRGVDRAARDRIGDQEDRFLATVFLGSGLLFVAMYWSGVAQLASLIADNRFEGAPPLSADTLEHARAAAFSYMFVLAARAAAVFVFVTSTIVWRSGTFPRWLAVAGYAIGLVMLVSISFLQYVVLLFPTWVFLVSAYVLRVEFRDARANGPEAT